MNPTELAKRIAEYTLVLKASADATEHDADRKRYAQHLEAAALMTEAISLGDHLDELAELVAIERRSFGWDYLSDECGERAEAAFNAFAEYVEAHVGDQK